MPGKGYGSLCNAVLALTAVVWERGRDSAAPLPAGRPRHRPLLTHAGRAFITEATLQVGADVNLRCRSFFDITAADLFAPPARPGQPSPGWRRRGPGGGHLVPLHRRALAQGLVAGARAPADGR